MRPKFAVLTIMCHTINHCIYRQNYTKSGNFLHFESKDVLFRQLSDEKRVILQAIRYNKRAKGYKELPTRTRIQCWSRYAIEQNEPTHDREKLMKELKHDQDY